MHFGLNVLCCRKQAVVSHGQTWCHHQVEALYIRKESKIVSVTHKNSEDFKLFIDRNAVIFRLQDTRAKREKTKGSTKLLLHFYCPQQRGVVTLPQMFFPRDKQPFLQSDMRLHYLVHKVKHERKPIE